MPRCAIATAFFLAAAGLLMSSPAQAKKCKPPLVCPTKSASKCRDKEENALRDALGDVADGSQLIEIAFGTGPRTIHDHSAMLFLWPAQLIVWIIFTFVAKTTVKLRVG